MAEAQDNFGERLDDADRAIDSLARLADSQHIADNPQRTGPELGGLTAEILRKQHDLIVSLEHRVYELEQRLERTI